MVLENIQIDGNQRCILNKSRFNFWSFQKFFPRSSALASTTLPSHPAEVIYGLDVVDNGFSSNTVQHISAQDIPD